MSEAENASPEPVPEGDGANRGGVEGDGGQDGGQDRTTTGRIVRGVVWLAIIAAVVFVFVRFDVQERLRAVLDWIQSLGAVGPLVFIGIYIVACVLFLPGFILTLGAGLIFGVVLGSVYVSIASIAGATLAFLIGRYVARRWVEEKISDFPRFRAIDGAVAREGWKIVGLTRLSPIFPFNFLNYAYGVTSVSLRDYVLASWVGMLPGTVMYVYFGSLAGDIATLGTGERETTPTEQVVRYVGLAAAVIVTLYVTHVAKKALAERVGPEVVEEEST